jgi:ketosteroid isomerase-like protein
MSHKTLAAALALSLAAIYPGAAAGKAIDVLAREAELRATETAFAKSMADRDLKAFTSFLAEDAVFFGGGNVLRGRAAIVAGWTEFFKDKAAPFSWAPQDVFVLSSGELGLSSGPVYAPDGVKVSFFTSTWRREADGRWLIVLDRGCPACN